MLHDANLRNGFSHEFKKKDLETKSNEEGSSPVHRGEIKHSIENTCYGAIALWLSKDSASLT